MRHQGTTETLSLVSFFSTVTSEFICNRYINTRVCACSLRFLGFMYQACPRVSFRLEMVSAVVIVFRFSCFDFPLLSSIALWRWCLGVAMYDCMMRVFSPRFVIETKGTKKRMPRSTIHDPRFMSCVMSSSCHQLQPGPGTVNWSGMKSRDRRQCSCVHLITSSHK